MSAWSLTPMRLYLAIAIPLTVALWGTFWLVRWQRGAVWMPGERRLVWVVFGCGMLILLELTVLVGIGTAR